MHFNFSALINPRGPAQRYCFIIIFFLNVVIAQPVISLVALHLCEPDGVIGLKFIPIPGKHIITVWSIFARPDRKWLPFCKHAHYSWHLHWSKPYTSPPWSQFNVRKDCSFLAVLNPAGLPDRLRKPYKHILFQLNFQKCTICARPISHGKWLSGDRYLAVVQLVEWGVIFEQAIVLWQAKTFWFVQICDW